MLGSGDSVLVLMHVIYLAHLLTVYNHTILTCTERVALGESASQKTLPRPLALSPPDSCAVKGHARARGESLGMRLPGKGHSPIPLCKWAYHHMAFRSSYTFHACNESQKRRKNSRV